jgi:hypothetical protein
MLSPTTPLVMRFVLAAAVTLPAAAYAADAPHADTAAKDACIKACDCPGCMEPLIGWQGQLKATSLDQFCDLEARDCVDPDMACLVLGDERPCLRRKSIILMDPPYPDVCIEDDHRAASQSLSSTLSNGRSYSTFNPLSGYRDMPPAAGVAIGLIVTSTRWPGSYGNWSRVTEPCAPTVVSMWTCLSG